MNRLIQLESIEGTDGTGDPHDETAPGPERTQARGSQYRETSGPRCPRRGAHCRARRSHIDFFLAHADKLSERVTYYSEAHLEMRERLISAHELLTWAEACTVVTTAHPHPWTGWNFTERFAGMPFAYRRSVIKDAKGLVRSYLSNRARWEASGKKRGKPGLPGASDHPTLYQRCLALELEALDVKEAFVRIAVYTGQVWTWMQYPVNSSRYTMQRLLEADWRRQSPTLVLRAHSAELHIPQVKQIAAKKVMERKQDPDLVTVAVDLNVKNLAVITARAHGKINQHARDKAYVAGVVTVEVNPHGTSQYCSRCGAKGERFSYRGGKRIVAKWGKLFVCPVCHYEANADFNASANVHHSFYREWHWQPRTGKAHQAPSPSAVADGT